MSQKIREPESGQARRAKDGLTQYIAELEEIYPSAKGTVNVLKRKDNRVIVSIVLPSRERERMRLFDQMAEIGTRILLETNQYIILSSR